MMSLDLLACGATNSLRLDRTPNETLRLRSTLRAYSSSWGPDSRGLAIRRREGVFRMTCLASGRSQSPPYRRVLISPFHSWSR